jgi:hypothetical protein
MQIFIRPLLENTTIIETTTATIIGKNKQTNTKIRKI